MGEQGKLGKLGEQREIGEIGEIGEMGKMGKVNSKLYLTLFPIAYDTPSEAEVLPIAHCPFPIANSLFPLPTARLIQQPLIMGIQPDMI